MTQMHIEGLYEIIPLREFRNTPQVRFHMLPLQRLPRIDSVDRVEHGPNAQSPTIEGDYRSLWYYHKAQTDNLLVFKGARITQLYTPKHGRVEAIEVSTDSVKKDGKLIYEGPAMLAWQPGVFHRVYSAAEGSLSLNFAIHHEGFSLEDNFDIYEVDVVSATFRVVRHGHADQK
ncbi:MAG: hypothetical protein HQL03_08810 [Nitrospirae bacterium]|nr:hypothetical protein [Nitrospirota bacterium]MBF0591976.1 hypothetical protein [Nitrospirota bacterium]